MPAFLRVFIINGYWILWTCFSATIEIIIWFLSFNLLTWCIMLIDLHIFKNPCIPGINPTWSWCMSFLICSWILFAKICWGFLHLCSSVILTCDFLFCVVFCWGPAPAESRVTLRMNGVGEWERERDKERERETRPGCAAESGVTLFFLLY